MFSDKSAAPTLGLSEEGKGRFVVVVVLSLVVSEPLEGRP